MATWKFSNLKKILFVFIIIVLVITMKLLEKSLDTSKSKRWSLVDANPLPHSNLQKINDPKKEFLKIFHLDLKGGPPKSSYLLKLLPLVKASGANAILMEYEDMFPFTGYLRNISAENAYSLEELKTFLKLAENLKMEVIPLVQTFGHLEYVLKLEEFQHLRELDSFPQEICPLKKEAVELIEEMIRQVMEIHKNSKYIHIGCDEVRHLGACPRCSRGNSKKIFSRHVRKIANYVKSRYPGITPLIWDDMLRRWTFDDMANSGLGSAVQPVIWVYGNNIFILVPRFVWNIYLRIFPKLWIASAFKGAFGETEILPDLSRHLENNLSWMSLINGEEEEIKIESEMIAGIFITGWSRYDHFAVLCELLPVGVPSLVLNLVFLNQNSQNNRLETFHKWMRILKCPMNFLEVDLSVIEEEGLYKSRLGSCSFPGSNLYQGIYHFSELRARFLEMNKRIDTSGWVTRYNVDKNFTSPWRILEMFPEEGFAGEFLKKEIVNWKSNFLPVMSQYFDDFTVLEWAEQNIAPMEEKIKEIRNSFLNLIKRKTWPRRPIR